jgi:uncharacterized membrane protein
MPGAWLESHATDALGLLFHVAVFLAYRVLQRRRGRHDPLATLQSQQASIRAAWVAEMIASKNGILAVQTLRNAMMGTVFFASNTMLLVLGALTLMAQGHLGQSWTLLDPQGIQPAPLAQAKVLLLLLTLLVAFFCFISALRLFAHASISVSATQTAAADHVTAQIDTAWRYQGLGVRCYYFAAPILFWLFGTLWLVLADLGALVLMQTFDRAPSRS